MSTMDALPDWDRVLAVVAHPDDESFGLGGVLGALAAAGSSIAVLSFTRGEASTLGAGDLAAIRAAEMRAAAGVLGVDDVRLLDYQDGALAGVDEQELTDRVTGLIDELRPDGMLVFGSGGITGHPDHLAASAAAVAAGRARSVPVLGLVLPETVAADLRNRFGISFVGVEEADLHVEVDRALQLEAARRHASQMSEVVIERLAALGPVEWLTWMLRGG